MYPSKLVWLLSALTVAPLVAVPESTPGKRDLPKCRQGMILKETQDGLHMKSTATDPQLFFEHLPKGLRSPLELEVVMSSRMGNYGDVFWKGSKGGYAGQRRIRFPVPPDGKRRTYRVELIGVGELKGIRFDPGPGPGEATLHRLTLIRPFGPPVELWSSTP